MKTRLLLFLHTALTRFYESRWGIAYAISLWNKYVVTDNYIIRMRVLGFEEARMSFFNEIWYHKRQLHRDAKTLLRIIFNPSSIYEVDYPKWIN